MEPWWDAIRGVDDLQQGDLVEGCQFPMIPPTFQANDDGEITVPISTNNTLIVLTHSCDLANSKAVSVALAFAQPLPVYLRAVPKFREKLESARQGRIEGAYLLDSPTSPGDNSQVIVVDFRQLVSLPFAYLVERIRAMNERWRLRSPYREHLSQAFARLFMRVALPRDISRYGSK